MIVSMFHVTVPADHAQAFEASWSQRAGLVDSMPGFLGMDVLRDGAKPGHYIVLTRWTARENFDAWVNSPAFTAGHLRSAAGDTGAAPMSIEFYEVVPSTPAGSID
jgi:heme-degrading monooxygenase HmoA